MLSALAAVLGPGTGPVTDAGAQSDALPRELREMVIEFLEPRWAFCPEWVPPKAELRNGGRVLVAHPDMLEKSGHLVFLPISPWIPPGSGTYTLRLRIDDLTKAQLGRPLVQNHKREHALRGVRCGWLSRASVKAGPSGSIAEAGTTDFIFLSNQWDYSDEPDPEHAPTPQLGDEISIIYDSDRSTITLVYGLGDETVTSEEDLPIAERCPAIGLNFAAWEHPNGISVTLLPVLPRGNLRASHEQAEQAEVKRMTEWRSTYARERRAVAAPRLVQRMYRRHIERLHDSVFKEITEIYSPDELELEQLGDAFWSSKTIEVESESVKVIHAWKHQEEIDKLNSLYRRRRRRDEPTIHHTAKRKNETPHAHPTPLKSGVDKDDEKDEDPPALQPLPKRRPL